MKYLVAALVLGTAAIPATASARDLGETATTAGGSVQPDTADQCMFVAAVRASYTAVRDDEVYGIARRQCHRRAAMTAADRETQASWANLIAGLRERRRTADALYGITPVGYAR